MPMTWLAGTIDDVRRQRRRRCARTIASSPTRMSWSSRVRCGRGRGRRARPRTGRGRRPSRRRRRGRPSPAAVGRGSARGSVTASARGVVGAAVGGLELDREAAACSSRSSGRRGAAASSRGSAGTPRACGRLDGEVRATLALAGVRDASLGYTHGVVGSFRVDRRRRDAPAGQRSFGTPRARVVGDRRRSLPRNGLRRQRVVRPGTPRSASSRGSMSSSGWSCAPSSRRSPQTTHRPGQSGRQSGAIGSASEIASRTGVSRSSSWWSVRRSDVGLVVGRQRAGRSRGRAPAGTPPRCRGRAGRRSSRRQRLHCERERGPQVGRGRGCRGSCGGADPAVDRLRQAQVVAEVDA